MMEFSGAVVVIIGLLGLFAVDRFRRVRTSEALWIPVVWLFIAGSRPLSFWLFPGMGDTTDRYVEGSPFDRNVFAALILAALIVLISRARKVGRLLRTNGPILLFLLYCGLSVFWSDLPDVAFKRWIRVVGDIAMVLVVLTDSSPSAAVKGLLARTGFVIIPSSILSDIGRGVIGREYHFGLTTNKNLFGLISMILGIGAVWSFLGISQGRESKGRTRRLLAYGSLVAMAVWCLWTANSTTSTACFLLGSSFIVATRHWSLARKPALVHLAVASLIILALYASILNPNVGIASAMGKDPTLTGRTDVWRAVIPMTPSPWFGAGFESFWLGSRLTKLWNMFVWHPNEAHNGYLEVYLNLGWMGVILLAVVMVAGYRKVVRGVRQDVDTGSLRLAYFVVAVIYNFTEAGFRTFSPMWMFLVLSIIGGFKPEPEDVKSQPETPLSGTFPKPELSCRDPYSAVREVDIKRRLYACSR
jgi:exopolysaccharide production protein ExoQ